MAAIRQLLSPEFLADPALSAAANAGTEYLQAHIDGVPLPAAINWRLAPGDGSQCELGLEDRAEDDAVSVTKRYKKSWLLHPEYREICVLDLWSELLARRFARIRRRVDDAIARELEAEAAAAR